MDGLMKYLSGNVQVIIFSAIRIALIFAGYFLVKVIINRVIKSTIKSLVQSELDMGARTARLKSIESVLKSACFFILTFILIVMLLQIFGINAMSLLTAAGVVGLAIGFGAQKLVKDVISGFFILMEDQYGVGDYVTIGMVSGIVDELGMRVTKIRDGQGKIHVFSNGDIIATANASKGNYKIIIDVTVAANNDIQQVKDILNRIGNEVAEELSYDLKHPLEVSAFLLVTAASVTIRVTGEAKPEAEFKIKSIFNEKLISAFLDSGIIMA